MIKQEWFDDAIKQLNDFSTEEFLEFLDECVPRNKVIFKVIPTNKVQKITPIYLSESKTTTFECSIVNELAA